mmetsp:Transcript_30429/g.53461  ORF Transcript_30429/g.53461 Transcript_30429/m.53461 type:complete len:149 (+) Transcript_30429:80-526(+)
MFWWSTPDGKSGDGYLPNFPYLGYGGKYISIDFCVDCGKLGDYSPEVLKKHLKIKSNNDATKSKTSQCGCGGETGVFTVGGKGSDSFWLNAPNNGKSQEEGYMPYDIPYLLGGEYIEVSFCVDCGKISGCYSRDTFMAFLENWDAEEW